jgi:gliding motility-associated-like protein
MHHLIYPIKRLTKWPTCRLIVASLLFVLLQITALSAQDTQSPIITSPARDTSFVCGVTSDLVGKLTAWYNNHAGATATDNSGTVTLEANLTLAEAIAIFNMPADTICNVKQSVQVIFVAVDPTGNESAPTSAYFYTVDYLGPNINAVPNVQYSCVANVRDSLISWIQNKAGYVANDACSNPVTWSTFQYAILSGNMAIQSGSGNIANGPYPTIPDGVCNWTLNINFFVRDLCNNLIITPGTTNFRVVDNVAPVFVSPPMDVTVDCSQIPSPTISAIDYCDMSVTPILVETNTKGTDETQCTFYDYTITRMWTVTDACGNEATHQQLITVKDTEAPSFDTLKTVNISCTTFDNHADSIYLYNIKDNCSGVTIAFTDNIRSVGCNTIVDRRYTLTDVCGNVNTFDQVINVLQNVDPIIVTNASNQSYDCQSQEDYDALLATWIQNMGGSVASSICGPLQMFAAVSGSFDINNAATYPGIRPLTLPAQDCPSTLEGFLRFVEVDFVYFDTCGNHAVTSAVFGVSDTNSPVISNCPEAVSVATSADGCNAIVNIIIPSAVDNCIESESPITRKVSALVTSDDPGNNESIVNPVTLGVGPFNPSLTIPTEDAILTINLKNLDIDDATEFFVIKDEDGQILGQTPNGQGQCSSRMFDLTLTKEKVTAWIQDGFIDLLFEPNMVSGSPVLSVNDICAGGAIETSISIAIDQTNTIQKSYSLDNNTFISFDNIDTLSLDLPIGSHVVEFRFTDCATNASTCSVPINVVDETRPIINCPPNGSSVLSNGVCRDTIPLPINFQVIENCLLGRVYDKISPTSKEAALLSFLYDDVTDRHLARNKQLVFTDVFPIRHNSQNVTLDIEFYGDNGNPGEFFQILGPGGYIIGSTPIATSGDQCGLVKASFEIPYDIFNIWIVNNQVSLLAIPNAGVSVQNGGINPCTTLTQNQTIDNESYLQGRLRYADATFTLSSNGATEINTTVNPNLFNLDLVLNGGRNIITLSTKDLAGNTGSCDFEIFVIDDQKPVAKCKNAAINIHPSGLEPYIIQVSDIDDGSVDNCGVTSITFDPPTLDCSMVGADVEVDMIVSDSQGNMDTCTSLVRVKAGELMPTFSAGLCTNDTLKLFANVPPSNVPNTYTFHWTGPGTIEFFTENPFIPNVNENFNGTYVLTVTGFNGCVSVGSVLVNIQPLTNPALIPNQDTICEGTELILTTTNYSGNISYEWYEGIFPTGVLLNITQSPELVISPARGIHFYYILAKGPDCSSNPSALLKVVVSELPVATVDNILLSPCEGDNIVLGTSINNPNFTYTWSGPAGYNETGRLPRIITNANITNAGKYTLVLKNGSCVSDTAVTTVVILERPTRPSISAADIFCQGATFNMIAINSPNGERYEWYLNDVLFQTTMDNSLIIANAQSGLQGTWKVRVFKGSCASEFSLGKTIAIDNLLEIGATNSGPVCAGDSIQLLATFVPNATYTWSGPVPNIPAISNPTILAVEGEYFVTITTPTACQNNANTTVKVVKVPEITALSNDAEPCMKSTDVINFFPSVFPNDESYTYQWTSNNGFNDTSRNPTITNVTQQDTGIYTLVVLNEGCPSEPFETVVSFNITPETPIITSLPFYCSGDTIKIDILNGNNQHSYEWNTPLGPENTNNIGLVIPNGAAINSGMYSLQVISAGCASDISIALNIEVRTKPQTPVITTNSPVCFGDFIVLNANLVSGATYSWTGPNFSSNERNPMIANATSANEGIYSLTIQQNGCFSDVSQSQNIEIADEIQIPAFSQNIINICQTSVNGVEICFDPSTIQQNGNITIVNNVTGEILTQGNTICLQISDLSRFSTGSNFLSAYTNIASCRSKSSLPLIINVNIPPDIKAQAIEDDLIACPGEFVQLISVHGPPTVNPMWTAVTPNVIISDVNTVSPIISGLQSGDNVILLDYNIEGCPTFSRDTINIYVEFSPQATDDNYELILGQEGLFNILSNDQLPDNANIIITEQPKYGIATVVGNTIRYISDPRYTETMVIRYQICADFCELLCDDAVVSITFSEEVFCRPPNIFTPNGDGMNDAFIVPCLDNNRFPNNRLIVFNEWGQEVYEGRPYQNNWEGSYGGAQLPVGTYFYVLDLGEGQKPINGFLILQR